MTIKHVVLVLAMACVCSYVSGHITLTFPPARKYAFDFMDNIRTRGPCGVPKGLGPVTDLTVGTIINVHWHTAYPHLGGYRIALLDSNEVETHVFTPTTTQYHGANDPTTLQYNITLPNQGCRNCSIQLIRQAGEWSSNCGDYIFYSCADVNILPQNAPSNNKCVHGTADSSGTCICERTYVGEQCTYKEDCVTNADCNNHGTCFRVSTTYYPHSQCYCKQGWFGQYCQLESPIKEKITDFSSYKMTELSSEYKLYHKILRETNEIEVVMKVKSLTWIGLGWRPSSFRSGCQYFPPLPGIIPGQGTGPTSTPESTAEPELTTEPEATSEPELSTEPEATTEPETTSEPEHTSEPTKEPTSEPGPSQRTCGGSWKSCGGSKCNYHAEWDYDVVKDEIKFTIAAHVGQSEWVAIGFSDNKLMPSSDVYIGWIHNGQGFVSDRWANGKWLPQKDTQQNVQIVSGSYNNKMATVSFIRKRNTGDTSKDIMFTDTYCPYFLFASGGNFALTTSGDYSLTKHTWYQSSDNRICIKACAVPSTVPETTAEPKTTPETTAEPKTTPETTAEPKTTPETTAEPKTTPETTAEPKTTPETTAEPKTTPETTAEPKSTPETTAEPKTTPETTAEPTTTVAPCSDTWEFCSGGTCYYRVDWSYHQTTDDITFTISANTQPTKWVAIGFSNQKIMSGADIVMGWYNQANNSYVITDRKAPAYYSTPTKDAVSNVELISGSYAGNMLTFTFRRKRNTMDPTDYVFTDTNCPYFLLAYGGSYDSATDHPFQHSNRFITNEKMCIKACSTSNRRKRSDITDNNKPGSCPPTTVGTCVEACNSDNSCQGDQKCCSNECGHVCTNPVNVPETTPEKVATSVPKTTPEGGSTSEPKSTAQAETVAEEPSACGSLPAGNSDTTGVNPHAMDCTDMVIGTARGHLSRIGDYYTRGRSTPQYDSFYGGSESLTAAFGYEEYGFTTIIFRKKLTANERSDLSILNEHMHVIWARGQDSGNYSHSPPTGIDRVPISSLSIPIYYKQDELKYHGYNSHRGVSRINFLEGEVGRQVCVNSWGTCTDSNCHMVHWSLDDTTKLITFNITADLENNQWVGLGFSDKKQMANADSIIGWVTPDGQVSLRDMKNLNTYGVPRIDTGNQDIQDIQGSRVGSRTTISFKRPLTTNDNDDFQFTETNCAYFMFPKGGDFDHTTLSFTRHDLTPIVSTNKICFPCTSGSTNHMYVVELRFMGIVWNRYYTDTTSEEYRNLKREVEEALTEKLKNSPGFQSVFIIRFKSGSVTAEIGIEMTGVETDTKAEVDRVLSDIVENEKVLSGYVLDHGHSLNLGDARPVEKNTMAPPPHEHEDEEIHIAVWFIVAIAGVTLLLITIMGLCNCFRKNKNTKRPPTQPYMHFQPDSLQYKPEYTQLGNLMFVNNGEQRLIQSPNGQQRLIQSPNGQQTLIQSPNGQQTLVRPQMYENWLETIEPKPSMAQNMHYDNPAYTQEEYKIETTFL